MATTLDNERLLSQWKDIRGKVRERWGQLSDDDLTIHGGNVEQFLNRLHKVTGEQLPVIKSYLAELLYGSSAAVARYAVEARERLQDQAATAAKLDRRRPMGAVGSAVLVGLVTGVMVGLVLRRR